MEASPDPPGQVPRAVPLACPPPLAASLAYPLPPIYSLQVLLGSQPPVLCSWVVLCQVCLLAVSSFLVPCVLSSLGLTPVRLCGGTLPCAGTPSCQLLKLSRWHSAGEKRELTFVLPPPPPFSTSMASCIAGTHISFLIPVFELDAFLFAHFQSSCCL